MISRMVPYNEIEHGSWTCRWGDWMIFLKENPDGWAVVVWLLPFGASMTRRRQIAAASKQTSAVQAITFACDVLRRAGIKIFVSGSVQALEKFLSFAPAPVLVSDFSPSVLEEDS